MSCYTEITGLKELNACDREKWKEEKSILEKEITVLKSKNILLQNQVDELIGNSTSQTALQGDKLETYAQSILKETSKTLVQCKLEMKIAFKLEDKVDNLKAQLDSKDTLITQLRKQITDMES